ncbi:CPBP family intramembrane metalloprotease [Facklamia sp. DSM 111018]|uniref:CPBP family intramembrane metalloprotease n=1 Tax=Facklamia lactis TaxID=2749967 RepID=A0ABS0LRR6_9LACT|nr:CPBP family intramembrane glutamic endopeptidase [Facklamia lactis]MBG9980943.1 CPBP family intramembrane metalloprotease [Facklamia lactis]MBG9986694.1 CPBP family intramembrane metalloprotease [Facklamia lactis]
MNHLIQTIVNSVVQIMFFLLIPLVWWGLCVRKKQSFGDWIGLKSMNNEKGSSLWTWIIVTTGAFLFISMFILYKLRDVPMATAQFEGLGVWAIPSLLIYAVFNTAFPEELFFRGFLLKRLANKWGFQLANIIQASVFALIHGWMFWGRVESVSAVFIIMFTGAIAWWMGYINEFKGKGSILPSWFIHAFANLFSGLLAVLGIF